MWLVFFSAALQHLVGTSNSSKAHVTRYSSGPATSAIGVQQQDINAF